MTTTNRDIDTAGTSPASKPGTGTPIHSARQIELPTTVRVRVEPQPERAPLVVSVRTDESPTLPLATGVVSLGGDAVEDCDRLYEDDTEPQDVALARFNSYFLTFLDEWKSEWLRGRPSRSTRIHAEAYQKLV